MALNDAYPFVHGIAVFSENNNIAGGDTIMCALVTNAFSPSKGLTAPQWGFGLGGTDVSAHEVAAGGAYSAGGASCGTASVVEDGDYSKITFGNPSPWAQDPNNPDDARYAIFYNITSPTKECLGWYDLGGVHDMSGGETSITVGSPFARFT